MIQQKKICALAQNLPFLKRQLTDSSCIGLWIHGCDSDDAQ